MYVVNKTQFDIKHVPLERNKDYFPPITISEEDSSLHFPEQTLNYY